MSRREAKRRVAKDPAILGKYICDMEGIFSTNICTATIDECPDVYKDPTVIMDAIKPTVTVMDRIKPIHSFKDIEVEINWAAVRAKEKKMKENIA